MYLVDLDCRASTKGSPGSHECHSSLAVVPGVHRNEGVKMCPKCREDPLSLSHVQEMEAESDHLSVASPFFS